MSLELTMQMVEAVGATPSGSSVRIDVDGPDDVEVVRRWTDATGNTVVMVHPDSVEIVRGRVADPLDALPPESRPGYRLWVYTNFHCNIDAHKHSNSYPNPTVWSSVAHSGEP